MLTEEVEIAQRKVKTDAYQLSIGEIVNMYKSNEFVINPDFQRLFRWELGQKSKLIESLLLGIPIPSIFVFEKEDSTWELIDGLQRISTLLEFMGELKDPATGKLKPPTALVATKYLPSLDNAVWIKSDLINNISLKDQNALLAPQQLAIKRSRLSVEILKRPSENATKYDLFQRLNAGGILANPQELRNCIVIMVNKEFAIFMRSLANYKPYRTVLAASSDQFEKQRDMEYVSRYLVYLYQEYDGKLDVEEYINSGIVYIATQNDREKAGCAFNATFDLLNNAFGNKALRRFINGKPVGKVGLVAFEGIAIGIAKNITKIQKKPNPINYIRKRVEEFWKQNEVKNFFAAGLRGTIRIKRTIPFGMEWFSK
jgi:hypothetical protein